MQNQYKIIENQYKIIENPWKINENLCKIHDSQQIVSAADVRRDSQISVAVSVILWTASEASIAEISLKLLEILQKL